MTLDADELTAWLSSIECDGRITPEDVVEAARDPDSPAHACFEWDDAAAAHSHRIEQARALLARRVVIKVDTYEVKVPRYVRDPDAPTGVQSYVAVRQISVEGMQRQALANEVTRVEQALARARDLAAVFGMEGDIDVLLKRVRKIAEKLAI